MKTADPELMRAINRFHVMDAVRRHGPISRVELSARTDLSPATISAITAALLDDGLIMPRSLGAIGDAGRGRPRVMLELNRDAARVVGVKLARDRAVFVLTDFQGEVLSCSTRQRCDGNDPALVADEIAAGLSALIASAGLPLGDLHQLCVALPGVVEQQSGRVRQSPVLNGGGPVELGALLGERLPCPVLVESEANAALVAQHWFRAGRDLDDFLVVTVDEAVGLGVLHAGEVYRGAGGLSFDLGALVLGLPAAGGNEPHRLAEAIGPEPGETVQALGLALANLIVVFSPARIVLTGAPERLGPAVREGLASALEALTPPWLAQVCQIVVDPTDDDTGAQGAAGSALRQLYGAPWGTTGPVRRRGIDKDGRGA